MPNDDSRRGGNNQRGLSDFLPRRGSASRGLNIIFEIEGDLTPQDLLALATDTPGEPIGVPPLQRITARHHQTARLVAEGRSAVDVALVVGMTPQRVRDLTTKDPAFKELVAYYGSMRTELELEDGARIRAKLVDAAEVAVDEIAERLDDPARRKIIPTGELRQIAQFALDRTVAPPKTAAPPQAAPPNITFNIAGRGITPPQTVNDQTRVIEHDNSPAVEATPESATEGDKSGG